MVIIAGAFSMKFLVALAFGYVFAVRDFGDFSSMGDIVLYCYSLATDFISLIIH